jgi:polar amino acid transport system substrate-binding protein
MRSALQSLIALVAVLSLAACSAGATASPSASAAAPSASEPSAPASASPAASASAAANACNPDQLQTLTAGKLTIGTDNPAYPPFFQVPTGSPAPPWELGDPTNGEGFEGAFAYALAMELGYPQDAVTWVVVPFDNAIAPGAKPFDILVQQISFTPERAQAVDLSDGYYFNNQSVVGLKDTPIASVKSVAGLKPFKFGAQIGTTSLDTINNVIAPTTAAMVYNTNDDAVAALKAKQIDGLVVDLPTSFYVTSAQVDNSVVVGQFPAPTGADAEHFSVVLAKGSSLTECVNQAIKNLKDRGDLEQLTTTWLADKVNAPVFTP